MLMIVTIETDQEKHYFPNNPLNCSNTGPKSVTSEEKVHVNGQYKVVES